MSDWRQSREYRHWRAKIIRRDKRCVICGSIKNRQAHHLDHATYFPEKRFDASNGVTLCVNCHQQFHNNFKRNTREKCTVKDFYNFNSLANYFKTIDVRKDIEEIYDAINKILKRKINV